MTTFLHFRYRVELSFQNELAYILHTLTRKEAEFVGKRWERFGSQRTWDVQRANYKQGKHGLIQVRFLFKGVRRRVLWVEPHLAPLLEEWFAYKHQPLRKTSWSVKFVRPSKLPF